jgi:hypothetical protein
MAEMPEHQLINIGASLTMVRGLLTQHAAILPDIPLCVWRSLIERHLLDAVASGPSGVSPPPCVDDAWAAHRDGLCDCSQRGDLILGAMLAPLVKVGNRARLQEPHTREELQLRMAAALRGEEAPDRRAVIDCFNTLPNVDAAVHWVQAVAANLCLQVSDLFQRREAWGAEVGGTPANLQELLLLRDALESVLLVFLWAGHGDRIQDHVRLSGDTLEELLRRYPHMRVADAHLARVWAQYGEHAPWARPAGEPT